MTRVRASARRDVADCCAPTSARSSDPPPFLAEPTLPGCFLAPGLFFGAGPTGSWQPHPLLWSLRQGTGQFLSAPLDGLLIQSRDLRKQAISTRPDAVGLHRNIPARLLLIQPTRAADSFADATLDQDEVCPAGNADTHSDAPLLAA